MCVIRGMGDIMYVTYTVSINGENIERRAHISAEPNATREEIEETIRAICAARGEIYAKLTHITE